MWSVDWSLQTSWLAHRYQSMIPSSSKVMDEFRIKLHYHATSMMFYGSNQSLFTMYSSSTYVALTIYIMRQLGFLTNKLYRTPLSLISPCKKQQPYLQCEALIGAFWHHGLPTGSEAWFRAHPGGVTSCWSNTCHRVHAFSVQISCASLFFEFQTL